MAPLAGSKERALFAQVVKNYENKQFKKGLRAADQILRKVPDHGDTQAMKALIINSQGHTDEAFALAKVALTHDMKSHICWHVYGLLYRSVKNFEEAIKAYKFALRMEPESQQIQRDLALLQMQMRDYPGYLQSRRAILQARTGLRQNWTALAVAQHLSGDLAGAERTLSTYEETLRSPPPKTDAEHSEAVLYKNTIIAEMGDTARALEHLDAIAKNNLDRTAVMEMRAQYLLRLERMKEAEAAYRALLNRNAEYRAYYIGLQASLGLKSTDVIPLKQMYEEYVSKNPKGDAARRIPLDFLKGDDFRAAAEQYLQHMLRKGIPSTFNNIKALYTDIWKRSTIENLVESFAVTQAKAGDGPTEAKVNGETSRLESSARFFLAQHYNYHLSRDLTKAMKLIDEAIASNPESVDYHMTKARIFKHLGNTRKASETMEKARSLDERDRYINTKAAKYQLRNNDSEAAIKNMRKFTRNEAVGGPLGDLHDMQCMWYIIEDGESYLRQEKLGLALKRFTAIYNIFDIWQEDQFDFHSFSFRKGQIRAYVDMIRWEDNLRAHPFFSRAAIAATKGYIMLHDRPHLVHGSLSNGVNGTLGGADAAERKKAQKKARKDQQKQEQIEAEKKDAKKTAGVAGTDGESNKEDKDPEGLKLLQTSEPLADAMKFVNPLLEYSPKNIDAQHVGFDVFIRRKKYLLALRCLLAAHSLSPSNPTTHLHVIRFCHGLRAVSSPLSPQVLQVVTAELTPIIPFDQPLSPFNSEFLARHSSSAGHVHAFLRARHLLDAGSAEAQNKKDLINTLQFPDISLPEATAGLQLLRELGVKEDGREEYKAIARKRWLNANAFESRAPTSQQER